MSKCLPCQCPCFLSSEAKRVTGTVRGRMCVGRSRSRMRSLLLDDHNRRKAHRSSHKVRRNRRKGGNNRRADSSHKTDNHNHSRSHTDDMPPPIANLLNHTGVYFNACGLRCPRAVAGFGVARTRAATAAHPAIIGAKVLVIAIPLKEASDFQANITRWLKFQMSVRQRTVSLTRKAGAYSVPFCCAVTAREGTALRWRKQIKRTACPAGRNHPLCADRSGTELLDKYGYGPQKTLRWRGQLSALPAIP